MRRKTFPKYVQQELYHADKKQPGEVKLTRKEESSTLWDVNGGGLWVGVPNCCFLYAPWGLLRVEGWGGRALPAQVLGPYPPTPRN